MKSEICIIAAAEFEAAPLIELLLSQNIETSFFCCGIGAIHAALNAKDLGRSCAGKHAIYLGTCGQTGPFDQPQVLRAERVVWGDYGLREGLSYAVPNTLPPLDIGSISHPHLQAIPSTKVMCAATISRTTLSSAAMTHYRDHMENLELYSVASALMNSCLTFTAVLATTNQIGEHAHEQWNKYFKSAANLSAKVVAEKLASVS